MKVLILNGSPRMEGNTSIATREMVQVFEKEGVEAEVVQIGNQSVRGCIACGHCFEAGKCVFDDVVNTLAPKFEEADGLVVASPVYYASANATLIACLDRLFYSTHFDKTMKVGASVVCARRGGCSATFDELKVSILRLQICRSHRANIGTVSTEEYRERLRWMKKESRRCAPLQEI